MLRSTLLLAVAACGSAIRVRMEEVGEGYPTYEEKYFEQNLDHFRFGGRNGEANPKWQQRYLINSDEWTGKGALKNGCKGPILFYSGNEGPIEAFWNSAGMVVNDLPKKWGALVVFGEHRYYGKSMPFGSASMDKENVMFLTTEQALADYAELITALKKELSAENCPVISFGGSYGATLTTFFRVKYPHIIAGGLAASTPLGYYDPAAWPAQGVTPYTWIDIVNKDYQDAGCFDQVVDARKAIEKIASTPQGRAQIQSAWKLCKAPATVNAAVFLFTDMIETFPQMDYPYQIGTTPAWPVNATCSEILKGGSSDEQYIATIGKMLPWYYGAVDNCLDAEGLGGIPGGGPPSLGAGPTDAWGYESCTETLHEFSGRGVRDFKFNMTQVNDACMRYFGVKPRPNWFPVQFGGYQINTDVSEVTKVIFSNGLRDPWHGGGFLKQQRPSCPVFIMPNGAHHVDLRAANPADTPDITHVREQEEAIIKQWIDEASQ